MQSCCRTRLLPLLVLALIAPRFLNQFGHNDQPGKGPERESTADGAFRDHLRAFRRAADFWLPSKTGASGLQLVRLAATR